LSWTYIAAALQLAAVDLLLGGDNAILIALASRVLPPEQRVRAMGYAVVGAVILRLAFATAAGLLLQLPLIKFVGGLVLLAIAIELLARSMKREEEDPMEALSPAPARPYGFWRAVGAIIAADTVMSLDNVMALASIAQGNVPLLALGILLGIPALVFGAYFVSSLLDRFPILIYAGGALLGWIAGEMAVSDALWEPWIAEHTSILLKLAPGLCAVYALIAGRVRAIYGMRPELGGALGKRLARRTGLFAERARELYAQRAAAYALRRRSILTGLAILFIAIGAGAAYFTLNV
jgi:YjbE family integral membrane protein